MSTQAVSFDPTKLIPARIRAALPSATLALTAKAKELKTQGKPVVSLAAGEPDFPVPEEAKAAIRKGLDENFTRYTPTSGTPELREAVRKKIKDDQGLEVKAANVAISCGAKHSLYNLIQVVVTPGDDVLLASPFWVSYPEMIKLAGGNPILVDTHSNGFLLTRKLIEKHLTPKTKCVILNSPSNPTGAVLSAEELKAIAALAKERGLYLISDEIYEYFVYDGKSHVSVASYFDDFLSQVAIVNGVSKSYAMTGLRIGYTVAHEAIIQRIGVLQDHSTSNPTSLSQRAALAAMGMGVDFRKKIQAEFSQKRDLMVSLLKAVPKLEVFVPQGAFYCFVSVEGTGLKADDFARRLLDEKFVAVIPGEGFGSPHYVRMSFAASNAEIQEGIGRIAEWVKSL